jgi:hypothetical protein
VVEVEYYYVDGGVETDKSLSSYPSPLPLDLTHKVGHQSSVMGGHGWVGMDG